MTPKVALVIVSHSEQLAAGVRELAGQMAPDVFIAVAGGLPDGGLGTSFDKVEKAMNEAAVQAQGNGVVILTDLGSATMTVESVLDFIDPGAQYTYADAPLVEGAVAAAVASQQGEPLAQVAAAAREAGDTWLGSPGVSAAFGMFDDAQNLAADSAQTGEAEIPESFSQQVTLVDAEGLHARPAAKLAQMAAEYDAMITVDGANAASVLQLMALGRKKGETVTVSAVGAEAEKAVNELSQALAAGLDAS